MTYKSDKERFWGYVSKIETEKGCWLWQGCTDGRGYGAFHFEGKVVKAYKMALIFSGVKVPEGSYIRHICDKGSCCNPAHLIVGTQQENISDAVRKKRMLVGEKNGQSKLTEEQVKLILKYLSQNLHQGDIAREFKISQQLVCDIKMNRRWKHVSRN